jgi:hypothetical protein
MTTLRLEEDTSVQFHGKNSPLGEIEDPIYLLGELTGASATISLKDSPFWWLCRQRLSLPDRYLRNL